jgi:hypothetical protein
MFREALEYPTESDDLIREYGIAVLLALGSIFVIPFFMLLGYYTKTIKHILNGEEQIPVFDDFLGLLVDGLKFFTIIVSYIVVPAILASIPEMIGLTGTVGTAAEAVGALVLLIGLYMMPSALVNFARNNRITAGFNIKEVGRKAFTAKYIKGLFVLIGTSLLISIAQLAVMLVLIFTILGIPALLLVLPAMQFYENLAYLRIMAEMAE